MMYFLYIALIISLLWAVSSLISRKLVQFFGNARLSAIVLVGCAIVSSAVFFATGSKGGTTSTFLEAAAAGLLMGTGYLLVFKSLETENAGSTFAFNELQAVLILLFGVLVLGESISAIRYAGVAFIVIGLFLVSEKLKWHFNKRLIPAIAGNVFWAAGWIVIYYPIHALGAYLYPIAVDYSFAAIVAVLYLVIRGSGTARTKCVRPIRLWPLFASVAVLTGVFGNILFSFIETSRYIAISSAIANTSPIIIILVAYFAYRERLTAVQLAGVLVAVLGTVIINIF